MCDMEGKHAHPRGGNDSGKVKGRRDSGCWAISWEQQREGVLMDILGQLVQDLLEVGGYIEPFLFEGVEHGHQNPSGMSARVGLGTKAGLADDDRGAEVPLGQVVLGRDGSVLGPEIEAVRILAEDILEVSDSQVAGGTLHGGKDLGLDLEGFGAEAGIRQGLMA